MPKAGEVAAELRRVADVLDRHAEVEIVKPTLKWWLGYNATKEEFLTVARVFPRPFDKSDGLHGDTYEITHQTDALRVCARIDRDKVCRLVKPAQEAEYECEPLLSAEEEVALTRNNTI